MATPLPQAQSPQPEQQKPQTPRTVLSAKVVDLVLVKYTDEFNQQQVQLGVVGDNTVHLLESRQLGISRGTTPQGVASPWLKDGVFKLLGRK